MRKKKSVRLKLITGLILMALLLVVVLTGVIERLYRSRMEEYYSQVAFNQASIAAEYIDGDSIEKYYKTGIKDTYYEEIQAYLQMSADKIHTEYFYVVVPEDDVMVYIWDTGEEEGVCELLESDAYYGGGDELMHAAFYGEIEDVILVTNNEEYGYLASAYVPIFDSNANPVALASVDISMDMINTQITEFIVISLIVTILILTISCIGYYFYTKKEILKPIMQLDNATVELVNNKLDNLSEFSVELKTGDEFEKLANSFNYMANQLHNYIKNLEHVTAEKERIGAELDVARQIQSSMLPCIFPAFPERKEFDIYAYMTPAKEVGGDFYDFFMVDDRHLAVVMADVSGKGVPAALFMVIAKTLIKDHTQPETDLGEVFTKVNNLLCESNSEGLFVTAFEGVLDLVTGELRFVNAGHEIPYIYKKNQGFAPYKIRAGFVLAGMEDMRYRAGSMVLEEGDKLFQYTDGVTEATNRNNELYGMERLGNVLNKNCEKTPSEILEMVKEDIDMFVGEADQFDDITMLCLEYKTKMTEL
ncbi:MAG: SpoIIE family protein phosphatase [Lachnospiraceae bacterium]|nr:SpoIIE family protein phosphatase [Lachnospiraceae bacterium]